MRRLAPGAMALLAGCIPQPNVTAPPPPPPPPVAAVAPPAPAIDWRDAPLTPGGWRYVAAGGVAEARFGQSGAAEPVFVLRCDQATRQVMLLVPGVAAGALAVRTSYGVRSLALVGGRAALAASDPLFDRIAFSRGRFAIEATGVAPLYLPAWAEPSRVIEDCRG